MGADYLADKGARVVLWSAILVVIVGGLMLIPDARQMLVEIQVRATSLSLDAGGDDFAFDDLVAREIRIRPASALAFGAGGPAVLQPCNGIGCYHVRLLASDPRTPLTLTDLPLRDGDTLDIDAEGDDELWLTLRQAAEGTRSAEIRSDGPIGLEAISVDDQTLHEATLPVARARALTVTLAGLAPRIILDGLSDRRETRPDLPVTGLRFVGQDQERGRRTYSTLEGGTITFFEVPSHTVELRPRQRIQLDIRVGTIRRIRLEPDGLLTVDFVGVLDGLRTLSDYGGGTEARSLMPSMFAYYTEQRTYAALAALGALVGTAILGFGIKVRISRSISRMTRRRRQ